MAIYVADVAGFSYKEIAEIVGTPVGTVMSRLHRGRRGLRAALEQHAMDRGITRPADGVVPHGPPVRSAAYGPCRGAGP